MNENCRVRHDDGTLGVSSVHHFEWKLQILGGF